MAAAAASSAAAERARSAMESANQGERTAVPQPAGPGLRLRPHCGGGPGDGTALGGATLRGDAAVRGQGPRGCGSGAPRRALAAPPVPPPRSSAPRARRVPAAVEQLPPGRAAVSVERSPVSLSLLVDAHGGNSTGGFSSSFG